MQGHDKALARSRPSSTLQNKPHPPTSVVPTDQPTSAGRYRGRQRPNSRTESNLVRDREILPNARGNQRIAITDPKQQA